MRVRMPRIGYIPERLLWASKKARCNNAYRCSAERDATAHGYRERDADGSQPVSRGDLYVRCVRQQRRPVENLSAVVQSLEREDGGGEYRPCLLYTSPSPRDGLLSR